MTEYNHVTGGDAFHLYKTACVALPEIENLYNDVSYKLGQEVFGDNQMDYGECFESWQELGRRAQRLLYETVESLENSRWALLAAFREFSYVDGDLSKGLNEIGKEAEHQIATTEPIEIKGGKVKPGESGKHASSITGPTGPGSPQDLEDLLEDDTDD